ncbi:MAG: hypothetical protein GXY34_13615 [Syntrophomonadaceae bacterium]|nr:hypothetical protein [Syntrophomonadaceae bacterium]
MGGFFYIIKENKYLTSGAKFTDNVNLAYLYDNRDEAECIARKIEGIVMARRSRKWIIVKNGMYLSNNGRFIEDIKEAYIFDQSTAEQYARELKGEAVESL